MSMKVRKCCCTTTGFSSFFPLRGAGRTFTRWASFRPMLEQTCSTLKVGRSSTTRSCQQILWPGPSDQDIMASSSHPTVNRIGLSTMPIRRRAMAAATLARPASNASPGTPMGRLTSAHQFPWVNLWKNPHVNRLELDRRRISRRIVICADSYGKAAPDLVGLAKSPPKTEIEYERSHAFMPLKSARPADPDRVSLDPKGDRIAASPSGNARRKK